MLYHKGRFLPSPITESELCIMGTLSVLIVFLNITNIKSIIDHWCGFQKKKYKTEHSWLVITNSNSSCSSCHYYTSFKGMFCSMVCSFYLGSNTNNFFYGIMCECIQFLRNLRFKVARTTGVRMFKFQWPVGNSHLLHSSLKLFLYLNTWKKEESNISSYFRGDSPYRPVIKYPYKSSLCS